MFVNDSVVDNLMTVVHDVFASMDPRLDDIVNSVVNRHSDNEKRELLTFLIQLKKEFNHYVNELDSLLLGGNCNGQLYYHSIVVDRAQIFNNLDIYHFRGKRSFERSDAGPVQILVGRV